MSYCITSSPLEERRAHGLRLPFKRRVLDSPRDQYPNLAIRTPVPLPACVTPDGIVADGTERHTASGFTVFLSSLRADEGPVGPSILGCDLLNLRPKRTHLGRRLVLKDLAGREGHFLSSDPLHRSLIG